MYRLEYSLRVFPSVFQVKWSFGNKDWPHCFCNPHNLYDFVNYINFTDLHMFDLTFTVHLVTRIFLFNYENNQQDALYRLIYYSKLAVHVSGNVFAHHQEHLTLFTVSGSVHPSSWRLVSRIRCVYTPHNLHSSISTHPRHQPAATWVNTTRYCKYSQVLLMTGKNIARNM